MAERNENLQRVRRIETQAAISGARVARIAQQRLKKRRVREVEKQGKPQQPQKKLTGPLFIAMLSLTLLKDILDIVFTFSVILIFFSVIFGLMVTFILLMYYMMNDVKLTSRKLVAFVISMAFEIAPFASIFPMASIGLILVRILENSERLRKMASKKTGFNALVQGI